MSTEEIEPTKWHTRESDELLLIQFVEDQGFDQQDLVDAANRLSRCIDEGLSDYGIPEQPNALGETRAD